MEGPRPSPDAEASTPAALFQRGIARARLGRPRQARADFEAALPALGSPCRLEIAFLDVQEGAGLTEAAALAEELASSPEAAEGVRARSLHLRGLVLGKMRKTGPAAEALLEAVELYRSIGERRRQAEAYDTLGNVYAAQGQLELAVSYYAVSIAEKALEGDRHGMAITLGNLGRLHLRAGRFREAASCFEMDLRISEEIGDEYGKARMLNDLGRARLGLHDFEGAIRDLERCLDSATRNAYGDLAFFAHKDLALTLIARFRREGEPETLLADARAHLEAAERQLRPGGDPIRESILLAARGELLLVTEGEGALEVLEEAAGRFGQSELPDLEIPARIALAEALAARGYSRTAERHLDRCLARARRDGYARYLPVVREAMKRLELVPSAVEEAGRLHVGAETPEDTDGYTHLRQLGKGGFGEVYRALDPRSNQIVAIKRLRLGELYDSRTRKRLLDSLRVEMEAASRIRHPGVARVLRIGVDAEDRPYLVLEYVDGLPLRHAMRQGGLPRPEVVAAFARDVAGSLQELHSWGIVHRDLKPENVILRSSSGEPVLIDFGIAHVPDSPAASEDGWIAGSLCYMAPEQASGRRVDGQADVYSLGVTLYEWLTGTLPLPRTGPSLEEFRWRILRERPAPLAARRPEVDPRLAALVDAMLQKSPPDRPTASEVRRGCDLLLGSPPAQPGSSRPGRLAPTVSEAVPDTTTTVTVAAPTPPSRRRARRTKRG